MNQRKRFVRCLAGLGSLLVAHAMTARAGASGGGDGRGYVTGFDAFVTPKKENGALVFIGSVKPRHCGALPIDQAHAAARPDQSGVQVLAYEAQLHAALQLATATCAEVEVSYEPELATSRKRVTRVRVLDR